MSSYISSVRIDSTRLDSIDLTQLHYSNQKFHNDQTYLFPSQPGISTFISFPRPKVEPKAAVQAPPDFQKLPLFAKVSAPQKNFSVCHSNTQLLRKQHAERKKKSKSIRHMTFPDLHRLLYYSCPLVLNCADLMGNGAFTRV